MPSYDIETIDGIPVVLRDGVMFAFMPPAPGTDATKQTPQTPVRLGTFDMKTKIATWEMTPQVEAWKTNYATNMAPRGRQSARQQVAQ